MSFWLEIRLVVQEKCVLYKEGQKWRNKVVIRDEGKRNTIKIKIRVSISKEQVERRDILD